MTPPLKGRRALITGGGSGIGRALARALNAVGVSVALVGRQTAGVAADANVGAYAASTPDLLMQPKDVAHMAVAPLALPRSAQVSDIHLQSMQRA